MLVKPASWSSGNAFVSASEGLRFKSRASQIGNRVTNGSPPLQHFFERSCVAWVQLGPCQGSPKTPSRGGGEPKWGPHFLLYYYYYFKSWYCWSVLVFFAIFRTKLKRIVNLKLHKILKIRSLYLYVSAAAVQFHLWCKRITIALSLLANQFGCSAFQSIAQQPVQSQSSYGYSQIAFRCQ